jgi:hypothetical protein
VLATVLAACGQSGAAPPTSRATSEPSPRRSRGCRRPPPTATSAACAAPSSRPPSRSALGDCEREIQSVLDDADSYELEVEDVRIVDRGRARARVQSGGDEQADRTIELIRVGPDWRISELGSPPRRQPS